MSEWKCTKCGETASSKCVAQRSVFPDNQYAAALGNRIHYEIKMEEPYPASPYQRGKIVLTWDVYIEKGEDPWQDFVNTILRTDRELLRIALCDHEWKIQSGECLFGCHKAEQVEAQ